MNPLISPPHLKHDAVAFDVLRPEHFMPALDHAIEVGRQHLARIQSQPASFTNTLLELELATEKVEQTALIFDNLLLAESNEALQALATDVGPKVAAFMSDILLDPQIFARINELFERRQELGLSGERLRLVEKIHTDFQRNGAGLDAKDKDRLRAIDARLAQLSPKFNENVLKSTNSFALWVDRQEDLKGLPQSQIDAAREAAITKGQPDKWLFTLQMPSYRPFMKFSDNRVLREKMYRAQGARALGGEFDNQDVLKEFVRLLDEKAKLLGYGNYAEYALEVRMAESPDRVRQFLHQLLTAAKPAARKDLKELQEFASQLGATGELQPWDIAYFSERLKEQRYAFDDQQLRPFFKLENVLNGVFEHARRLFGLLFKPNREYPVYHPDVQVFEVVEESTGDFVGLFYADFFPRPSKSGGAWMTVYRQQCHTPQGDQRPHVSIVCNFTKPTADAPSLLSFDEVTTLFHEFGHALHGLLSKVEMRSLSGTNVYLDFVELPSQIFENWAEEQESLKLFAHHYKTGEVIPMALIEKMKRAQLFQAGYTTLVQLNYAYLDLSWFLAPPAKEQSVVAFERQATSETQLLPPIENTCISTSFGHIFGGGYASGYYSYKWAEALEADAFELFVQNGIFHKETAQRFAEFILTKGGSDHPLKLYEKFRGRSPDPEALLRRDGLI